MPTVCDNGRRVARDMYILVMSTVVSPPAVVTAVHDARLVTSALHVVQQYRTRTRTGTVYLTDLSPAVSAYTNTASFTYNCVIIRRRSRHKPREGRINHSGAPYQRKAGALFSYAKPGFSYLWRCTFFPKKVDDIFSRRYV